MTTKKRQKYNKSNLTWGKQNNPHPDKAFKGFRSYFPAVENFISTVTVAEYGKLPPIPSLTGLRTPLQDGGGKNASD